MSSAGSLTVSSADGGFARNEVEVIITTADLDRLLRLRVLGPVLYAIIERAKQRGATRRDHVRHPRHGLA